MVNVRQRPARSDAASRQVRAGAARATVRWALSPTCAVYVAEVTRSEDADAREHHTPKQTSSPRKTDTEVESRSRDRIAMDGMPTHRHSERLGHTHRAGLGRLVHHHPLSPARLITRSATSRDHLWSNTVQTPGQGLGITPPDDGRTLGDEWSTLIGETGSRRPTPLAHGHDGGDSAREGRRLDRPPSLINEPTVCTVRVAAVHEDRTRLEWGPHYRTRAVCLRERLLRRAQALWAYRVFMHSRGDHRLIGDKEQLGNAE